MFSLEGGATMPVLNKYVKFYFTRKNDESILKNAGYTIQYEDKKKFVIINQLDIMRLFPKTSRKDAVLDCECNNCKQPFQQTPNKLKTILCNKCKKGGT